MTNSIKATNELHYFCRQWKEKVVRKWFFDVRKDMGTVEFTRNFSLGNRFRIHSIGNVRVLESLCRSGADLDYLEKELGFSCIPSVFWSEELIQFFINKGRDVNSQDQNGDTALHLALRHGTFKRCFGRDNKDKNIVQFLLDHSADPNVANFRGETALFTLTTDWYRNPDYYKDSFRKVAAELILRKGGDLKTRNNDGESLLHRQEYENTFNIKILSMQKFGGDDDVDLRTSSWLYAKTPLMIAAGKGKLEFCKMLIQLGSDVNATDLQGYSALHHSVMTFYSNSCSEFLVGSGADLNAKSASGKDVYELAIQSGGAAVFTYGVKPEKQLELFQLACARDFMMWGGAYGGYNMWKKAMEICEKFQLKPSSEFLAINYEDPNMKEMNYVAAVKTVASLSKDDRSKFWNLLAFTRTTEQDFISYVFETLNYLSEELKRVGDFASYEEYDFRILSNFAEIFKGWLTCLIQKDRKGELTGDRISHMHSFVSLAIACFEKLMHKTKSNKITCMKLYGTLVNVLTLIRSKLNKVITERAFVNNERLLRALINLDLRNRDGDTLMHLALSSRISLDIDAALDLLIITRIVTSKNQMGFEPVQTINDNMLSGEDLIVKIVDRGAHIDARNHCSKDGKSLKEMLERKRPNSSFTYDTLQCMCARVIVRSLVPFRNRVPKMMVDFILMH